MSEKISNLPVATDVIGADVPVVQGGTNKKAASTLFATVYPVNEIVFGDGATAGGITEVSFTFTPLGLGLGGIFSVSGGDGISKTAQIEEDGTQALIRFSAHDTTTASHIIQTIDSTNGIFTIEDSSSNTGIYYAGLNSQGLGAVVGLGIDIKNYVYTLGNPATSVLTLYPNTLVHTVNGNNYLELNATGKTYAIGDLNSTGNGLFFTVNDLGSAFEFRTQVPSCILGFNGNDIDFSDNVIRCSTMHNSIKAQGNATEQDIRSGTYTPTLTSVLNVDSTVARRCQWMRVGNVITVSGQFDVTPTANNSATKIGIELPVASVFTTAYECAGTGHCTDTSANHHGASIYGDPINARAELSYYESHGTADTFTFTFTYEVI